MTELTTFKKRSDRFLKTLDFAVKNFRKGNDHLGLESFLNSIDDLENLLEYQQYTRDIRVKIDKIIPVYKTLYEHVVNQDIIGITDVLEFTLYPLVNEWIEGATKDDCS